MTGGKGGRGQMLTRASACRPPLYRLAQDVSYGAYPSLCSLVSHCYDPEGKIMGQIMVRMDIPPPVVVVGGGGAEETETKPVAKMSAKMRRQLYALLKIVIEKWPASCVENHMARLCEVRNSVPEATEGSGRHTVNAHRGIT